MSPSNAEIVGKCDPATSMWIGKRLDAHEQEHAAHRQIGSLTWQWCWMFTWGMISIEVFRRTRAADPPRP